MHVISQEQALELVDINEEIKIIFKMLADRYWPGPLTIILKANEKISDKITANTGYVGLRHPDN